MNRFSCPACGVPMQVEMERAGRVRCPGCRSSFEIPPFDGEANDPAPLPIDIRWIGPKTLSWSCPTCALVNNFRASSLGTRTQCKGCKFTFRLPAELPAAKRSFVSKTAFVMVLIVAGTIGVTYFRFRDPQPDSVTRGRSPDKQTEPEKKPEPEKKAEPVPEPVASKRKVDDEPNPLDRIEDEQRKRNLDRVQELVKQLGSSFPEKRRLACKELGAFGPFAADALPRLREVAASDQTEIVRITAQRAIQAIESK